MTRSFSKFILYFDLKEETFLNPTLNQYQSASINVLATRQDKPPMIDTIEFELIVKISSKINLVLLMRNLKKFGTIYNALDQVCEIRGVLKLED